MKAEELIAFEADIAAKFNAGHIRAPIHLSGGNEQQLIELFKNVGPTDWCFVTWRSHYACLLKGVPPEKLKADIMAGKSITLNYPAYRIVSSAIVGGIIPIALGVALSIKRSNWWKSRVWVFIGDMTKMTGIFHECSTYAVRNNLPITFVIEDNGKSVCTDTQAVWGKEAAWRAADLKEYDYVLPFPHAGAGKRVQF